MRGVATVVGFVALASTAAADVTGKVELPAGSAAPPPLATRGFLERSINPYLPVKPFDHMPFVVVVLVGEGAAPGAAVPVAWDLVGESFARPLIAVRSGSEVTIRNKSKRVVTLQSPQKEDLLSKGPINIGGSRPFAPPAGFFTVIDPDLPHLLGRVVVVDSPYFAIPERDGKFELKGVPPGSYAVKLWYRDGWLDRPDDTVTVGSKGDATVSPKIPAGFKVKTK
jgi:hypothetical protein